MAPDSSAVAAQTAAAAAPGPAQLACMVQARQQQAGGADARWSTAAALAAALGATSNNCNSAATAPQHAPAPSSVSTDTASTGAGADSGGSCVSDDRSWKGGCGAVYAAHHQQQPHAFVRFDVPHIPQRFNWDCGLACVLMALRALGVGWQQARYKDLLRLCPTTRWALARMHAHTAAAGPPCAARSPRARRRQPSPRLTPPDPTPPKNSVWTIDLAHLLARFGVRVALQTITIGADHSYANEAFYAPHWGSDAARVQHLFESAPAAGITVAQRR
jgi:hypothetical protein